MRNCRHAAAKSNPLVCAGAQVYRPEYLAAVLAEDESPYPDTSLSGLEDFEDESVWRISRSVRLGQGKLLQLQQALPRRCRLTNSGHHKGLRRPWGEAATELPAWHVWNANLYTDMDAGERTLRGV